MYCVWKQTQPFLVSILECKTAVWVVVKSELMNHWSWLSEGNQHAYKLVCEVPL
jgi:hypothetical protein